MAGETKAANPGAARPVRKQRLRLWIRLLRARQVIEAELRKRLRDRFDMTMPQFDVMAALERNPEGMTMSSLSEALMVSNGNVTGIIDRLMARKYVAREAFAGDRRRFIVRLTPAGLDQFRSVATQHESWVDELMSVVEIDQAENALGKLAARR
ncbi:MarR family winged helix-turn-helix transcriptional regulator [Pseudolabrys sp. FHR47]|uniref:MarR family winged helix-turn-helix transcriptional regulator n=1 Tax=Pseudolabrys sp. FHR47 TaxID=2562284 RepID=UPI001FED65E0|nr:MarR family transcriptional regulator [Pseudolabrys sp. FHR47]